MILLKNKKIFLVLIVVLTQLYSNGHNIGMQETYNDSTEHIIFEYFQSQLGSNYASSIHLKHELIKKIDIIVNYWIEIKNKPNDVILASNLEQFVVVYDKNSSDYREILKYRTSKTPENSLHNNIRTIKFQNGEVETNESYGRYKGFNRKLKFKYNGNNFQLNWYKISRFNMTLAEEYLLLIDFEKSEFIEKYCFRDPNNPNNEFTNDSGRPEEKYVRKGVIFFAPRTEKSNLDDYQNLINQKKHIFYKPENWKDSTDISFSANVSWSEQNLILNVSVTDDLVFFNNGTEPIINGDHLELWIDFNSILQTLKREDGQSYKTLRNYGDSSLVQIIIPLSNNKDLLPLMINKDKEIPLQSTRINTSSGPKGYDVNASINMRDIAELIGEKNFKIENKSKLGFSIVISDSDSPGKTQDCLIGSSKIIHNNPTSLGYIFSFDEDIYPSFMNWEYWEENYLK
jgi:hypothetical protein